VSRLAGRRRREDPLSGLTEREREVLALVVEGLSNLAIANRLLITERTVEVHTKQVFGKLGLEADPASNRRVFTVLASSARQSHEASLGLTSSALWRCVAACP
jgi:DNA-binding NarL/FixJ family response regulator